MDKLTREKVLERLTEELERIETLQKLKEEDKEETDEYYEKNREPLSVDVTKEVKILLSWGGGEDGFKLTFDKKNELISGIYYMANWGEYKEVDLEGEELQQIYDHYLFGDVTSVV